MKKRATRRSQPVTFGRLIKIWLIQHAQAFIFSLGQMSKNPIGSLLTIAVIGVSLSLPAGFYLLLDNAHRITAGWASVTQITLFLKYQVDENQARALVDRLSRHEDVDTIKLIDRDAALDEYRNSSGFSEALAALDTNPLPIVLLIQPTQQAISTGRGERLLESLRALDEVETAQFDRQWASRLFAIIGLFQRVVAILSTLLAFAVLLIVGNTIRLAIYNRRPEIEINKLFGATDGFIQRPFLYSGLIHGISGSIMAWILLSASIKLLEEPVMRLSGLYFSNFKLISLNTNEALILVASGGLLGLLGSWFAVQRHFKAIGLT
ncbi:MAG: permease-like cell division protein FtsX [Gammaproteobacteria bacterium]